MTPRELADALESMAEEPTLGIALSSGDVAELLLAAQTLRALEAAATEYRRAVDAMDRGEEGWGYRLHEAEVALDAALGGGT